LPYGEVAPCTVLDPFGGAGTVSLLANRLGRRSIYIDLSPKYVEMAAERLRKDSAPATHVSEQEGEAPLFAGQESDHD
jgi:DNA modification methylase